MASTRIFISFVILAVSVPMISATEFVVGDEHGWTLGFDYQAWALGKEFHVGDTLVFKYPEGVHNVLRVNATGFQQCMAPASTQALTTGNDVITITSEGRKWYICGVGRHCEAGKMKLAITVQPWIASSPSPTQAPVSAAAGSSSFYSAWTLLILAVLMV
ncbi:hypothetical protein L6164_019549 [Bauhinia variegata]|uniref:Uncharacterized protein n=1 Tax=Bauhinia variegata TaxID=167791 RepID=A0ACB9MVM4_BAUVA|nr:hypothetical protein L6164_019549 [Bauhinia variegata]